MNKETKENKNNSSLRSHIPSRKWLSFSLFLCILSLVLSLSSCASSRDFSKIDASIQAGDFSNASIQIEEDKNKLYDKTDKVLYALDSGLVSHYNKDYEQSNKSLSEAEKLMAEYYAISITQTIGSFILNDNVIDYAGEDFEDIYVNLFMALNYIQLGDIEGAFVEIRRFNNKLTLLSTKYTHALEQARQQTSLEGYNADAFLSEAQGSDTIEFYDSAFARYVSLLLYRSSGQMDSAAIDKKFIETAFYTQSQLYPFSVPKAVEEEFTIPNDKERLNVFCYTGTAPEKTEEVLRLPGIVENTWFKLSLPIMHTNSSSITAITVEAMDENGNTVTNTLERIESIENIAVDTFQQRQGLIYLKALLRSISKTAVNAGVTSAMEQSQAAAWASLFNLAANVFTEFSEQADIRASRYFPALVWVGGLNVDKGLYTVTTTCYDRYNNIVYEQINNNVQVKSNNVNLVEAVCLQ